MRLTLDDFRMIALTAVEDLDDDAHPLGEWMLELNRRIRANAHDAVPGLDDYDD